MSLQVRLDPEEELRCFLQTERRFLRIHIPPRDLGLGLRDGVVLILHGGFSVLTVIGDGNRFDDRWKVGR